jgi:two-component system, OmpR family, phosphate regulon sensor histidine kinase PhoR
MPVLMGLTILGIAGFQMYWLKKAYEREKRTLDIRTSMAFRESVYSLQGNKLNLDKVLVDSGTGRIIEMGAVKTRRTPASSQKIVRMFNELNRKAFDSSRRKEGIMVIETDIPDSVKKGGLN